MRDKLKLKFPWKILKDIKPNSVSNFKCQSTNDEELYFKVSREADSICLDLSGTLSEDLQIELTKCCEVLVLNRGVQFQFNAQPSTSEHEVTIHQMVNKTGRSLKRKRTKKLDADFVLPDSIPETDEQVMFSFSLESLLSSYATVSGPDESKKYSCKICSEEVDSLRRFYCHVQKHGDFRPWACQNCDFATSFQSLLVSHAASVHGLGAAKKARTTQCLKVGLDTAPDTEPALAKAPVKKGEKKKGGKNSKPTLICLTRMSNDEVPDLNRGVQFQFNAQPSSSEHEVTIHRMVNNTGRSLKRKRTKKIDADFVSSDSIPETDEQVMFSFPLESLLSNYATVSGPDESKKYSCKICSEEFDSLRRVYCHVQKHGDFRPWACQNCDFATSFQSLLVSHAASEHGLGAAKKARTTQCLKVGLDTALDTEPEGRKKKGGKNSKPTLICVTPAIRKNHDKPQTSQTETGVVGDTDEDGSKTVAVEIEVHEEPVPKPAKKVAKRSGQLIAKPLAEDTGTIAVVEDESAVVANIGGVAVIQTPKQMHIQGAPDLDPRLRKVAKNYQFVIDEYCELSSEGFSCKLCRQTFWKREHFMQHLHKQHQECKPYYCLLCDFRTRSKPNVFTHNSFKHTSYRSRPFTCTECGVACLNKSRHEIHMQTHSSEKNFKCELCERLFVTKRRRQEHIKRAHQGRPFACSACDMRFATKYALRSHGNVHEPGKRWKCIYCQKMYRSETSLKIHMHSHTTVFHCEICDKDMYSYSAFNIHKNLHDPKSKKHRCDVCNKLFPTAKICDRHVLTRHSESTFDHKCWVCFKGFKLSEQLTSHMVCHSVDKPWVCNVCGQRFKRQSSLCTHRNKHKLLNRAPFICTYCRTEFASFSELATHLVEDEKAGLCAYCHRVFNSKPLLDQHLLTAHKDDPEPPTDTDPRLMVQPATALQEYLTKPIENNEFDSQFTTSDAFDSRLVIEDDQATATSFHLAPTRVRTKVIHSDPGSSVVTQFSTRPAIERPVQHGIGTREQVQEARETQSTNFDNLSTLQWTDQDGNVVDVVIPVLGVDDVAHEVMEVVGLVQADPGSEGKMTIIPHETGELKEGTMTVIPHEAGELKEETVEIPHEAGELKEGAVEIPHEMTGEISYGTLSEQEVDTAKTLMLVNDPNREHAK